MVLAVGVGVVLAALLFMQRMAALTGVQLVTSQQHPHLVDLPKHIAVYDINGPLFFCPAEKAMDNLRLVSREVRVVIVDMTDVSMMDITAIVVFDSLLRNMRKNKMVVIVSGLIPCLITKLEHADIRPQPGALIYCDDLKQAVAQAIAHTDTPHHS